MSKSLDASNTAAPARLDDQDRLLLRVGQLPDGVMADDLVPDTLDACERMLRLGYLRRGMPAGVIRTYHTTEEGVVAHGRAFAEAHHVTGA